MLPKAPNALHAHLELDRHGLEEGIQVAKRVTAVQRGGQHSASNRVLGEKEPHPLSAPRKGDTATAAHKRQESGSEAEASSAVRVRNSPIVVLELDQHPPNVRVAGALSHHDLLAKEMAQVLVLPDHVHHRSATDVACSALSARRHNHLPPAGLHLCRPDHNIKNIYYPIVQARPARSPGEFAVMNPH